MECENEEHSLARLSLNENNTVVGGCRCYCAAPGGEVDYGEVSSLS